MRRALGGVALLLALFVGTVAVAPVEASIPQGAITWTVDDTAKTITVSVKLQIYSACDDCPGAVNQLLADKMKAQMLDVWNPPLAYHYRCYELIFDVDIKLGTDRFHIDDDRVGVRIDNSPVDIRSFVRGVGNSKDRWRSNDPADKLVPTNDVLNPTTWVESANRDGSNTYAHEFGHVIGLSDAYVDQEDPNTGETISVPRPGAPLDLMSTLDAALAQETIDRLVERSPVDRAQLKCGWVYAPGSPIADGKHCDSSVDGEWVVNLHNPGGGFPQTGQFVVTIDGTTLNGTYVYDIRQTSPDGSWATWHGTGDASIVLQPDGSVPMSFHGGTVTITQKLGNGGTSTQTLPDYEGQKFVWMPATTECR